MSHLKKKYGCSMDFDECIDIVLDILMHCHCLRNIPMHFHFVRNIRSFCCRCVTYVWSCVYRMKSFILMWPVDGPCLMKKCDLWMQYLWSCSVLCKTSYLSKFEWILLFNWDTASCTLRRGFEPVPGQSQCRNNSELTAERSLIIHSS